MCEKEGLTKDMKRRAYYEKPSERKQRAMRKSIKRAQQLQLGLPPTKKGPPGSKPTTGSPPRRGGPGGPGGRGGPGGGRGGSSRGSSR